MKIVANLKGELPIGEEIVFYKMGGTLPVDQFYEGLNDGEKEKFDYIRQNGVANNPQYIKRTWEDDVEIETGKTYLVYLRPETTYRADPNTYAIVYAGGGTREVQLPSIFSVQGQTSISGSKVLNNFTGEWESLDDIARQVNAI